MSQPARATIVTRSHEDFGNRALFDAAAPVLPGNGAASGVRFLAIPPLKIPFLNQKCGPFAAREEFSTALACGVVRPTHLRNKVSPDSLRLKPASSPVAGLAKMNGLPGMRGVKVVTGAAASVLLLALMGPLPALADTIEAALVRAYQNNPQLTRSVRSCAPPMKACRRRCRAIVRGQPHRQRRLSVTPTPT